MKKIIILSFIFLFFAGINNNANAQKEPAHTWLKITYDWHCTQNPNADLTVDFDGTDQYNQHQTYNYVGTVGSDQTKIITPIPWIRYKSVTVDISVNGNFAWARKTVNVSAEPYIYEIPVTLDIYDEPPMQPGW